MSRADTLHPQPRPLHEVIVPEAFYPSSFHALERCPLSVLGLEAGNDLLPNRAEAVFGSILHHVLNQIAAGRWAGRSDAVTAADYVLEWTLRSVERQSDTSISMLRDVLGRRRWGDGRRHLLRWAQRSGARDEGTEPEPLNLWLQSKRQGQPRDGFDVGRERLVASRRLRLVGRPDFSRQAAGSVHIVDYKSGRVLDASGEVFDEHLTQLRLYALVAEEAFPDSEVHLYVEHGVTELVRWDAHAREVVRERLEALSARLPAGRTLDAESLAHPGSHCVGCRIRHRCGTYLATVPSWWPDAPGNPRPLPLDVWGAIVDVRRLSEYVHVRLHAPVRGEVSIEGLAATWGIERLGMGSIVSFFGLASTEDLNQHGARIHPLNFHEHPPGPRWDRAWNLRVFSGDEAPSVAPRR